jgi:hypothetical protein
MFDSLPDETIHVFLRNAFNFIVVADEMTHVFLRNAFNFIVDADH